MTQIVDEASTYDDFAATVLDPSRWRFLELPRGVRAAWRCEEPLARTEVGEGTLDMHVNRFTRGHDRVQIFDNLKHQLMSTWLFTSPERGSVTYSAEVAATNLGQSFYDWRDGQATLTILDPATGWAFRTFTTSNHVFAVHEPIRADTTAARESIIECGSSLLTVQPGVSHRHDITLNFAERSVEWRVDSEFTFGISDCVLPDAVHLGLGITTLQPIRNHRTQSLRGQGLSASFGPISISYV
jgi:hypothetical protein